MATPDITLITRAEVTSIADATTGRKALVLDGATIELGDTGLRDLRPMFTPGRVASGRVLVQRVGSRVTWYLDSLNLAAGVTTIWNLIPAGGNLARFAAPVTAGATLMQSKSEYARLVIGIGGSIDIHFGASGINYIGVISYDTKLGWPVALPGVADGQPVGV